MWRRGFYNLEIYGKRKSIKAQSDINILYTPLCSPNIASGEIREKRNSDHEHGACVRARWSRGHTCRMTRQRTCHTIVTTRNVTRLSGGSINQFMFTDHLLSTLILLWAFERLDPHPVDHLFI